MSQNKVLSLVPNGASYEPPADWDIRSPFGFLSFDSGGEDGRLARIGDVLRWLESVRCLPRSKALDVLLDGLPDDARDFLYRLRLGQFAEPVPSDRMFGFHTQEQHETAKRAHEAGNYEASHQGRRVRSPGVPVRWGGDGYILPRRPITPYAGPHVSATGLPALRLLLTCWQSETRWLPALRQQKNTTECGGPGWPANYLAVPLCKAFEWWGYGRLVEANDAKVEGQPAPAPVLVSPAAQTKPDTTKEWDEARIVARHAELKRDKQGKFTQRLAMESGWSDRDIRRAVQAAKVAGPMGQMAGALAAKTGKRRK